MKSLANQRGIAAILEIVVVAAVLVILALAGFQFFRTENKTVIPVDKLPSGNTAPDKVEAPVVTGQPGYDCSKIGLVKEAFYITLYSEGADRDCVQMSKQATLGVNNNTGTGIIVTLGDQIKSLPDKGQAEFDMPLGEFLKLGANDMRVSTYDESKYPQIWTY